MTKHFGAFLHSGKHGQGLDLESEHLLLGCVILGKFFFYAPLFSVVTKDEKNLPTSQSFYSAKNKAFSQLYVLDRCYYCLDLLIVLDISKNTRVPLSFLIQCNI